MRATGVSVLFVVAMAAITSITLQAAWRHDDERSATADGPTYRPSLSTPIATLKNEAIVCPASGGTPLRIPSGTITAHSIVVQNTSTTCVQLGGSAVTATTGAALGSGCALGQTFAADLKEGYCISSGVGTVTVQVIYGSL